MDRELSRRDFFRNAGVAGLSLSALMDLAWPPAASASTPKMSGQLIGKLEGPTTVTDQAKFPKTFREAPQLAELVKAGKLPSVKERIEEDPLVIKPVHEIGRYGGTIRRGFTGPGDWSEEQYVIGTVGLAPGIMGLRVCKNSLGNVPQRMFNGSSTLHPKQSKPETAFYKR